MKLRRYKKVLGLAISERSVLVAEVAADEAPRITRMAEFVYTSEFSAEKIGELGPAFAQFLRDNQFTARAAVIGLPARWLLVKPKEVPPADPATLADLLRLQAEGEFSSELKDLVYDYAGEEGSSSARTVLLLATPRKYIDAIVALSEMTKLNPIAVTASAAVLGAATARSATKNAVVLAVGPSGAELTAQSGEVPSAIRHLRGTAPQPIFISELRRAVSMLPVNGTARELVVWDGAGIDADQLGAGLGFSVRRGDLNSLGAGTGEGSSNGASDKYAAAVTLALAGIGDRDLSVDFLHSRLAPPKKSFVPRSAVIGAIAAIVLIAGVVLVWNSLQKQQTDLNQRRAQLDRMQPELKVAQTFVDQVSFARAWQGGDPRYLWCLRHLNDAIPDDGQTYATSLIVREEPKPTASSGSSAPAPGSAAKAGENRALLGELIGKSTDQNRVQTLLDQMKHNRAFSDVKLRNTQDAGRNSREVAFSITFTYTPPPRKAP